MQFVFQAVRLKGGNLMAYAPLPGVGELEWKVNELYRTTFFKKV